jgi:KDO2-lipid IV(A) lauroyltransferase
VKKYGKFLGTIAFHLLKSRRNVAMENLRYAFPKKSDAERERITKGAFENFGISMTEFLWARNYTKKKIFSIVEFEGKLEIEKILAKNSGIVLVSGHLGNWEMMALATGLFLPAPVLIIVKKQHNEIIDKEITKLRCIFGNCVVTMEKSIKESLIKLKSGGIVAILSDQSAPKESVYVNFFGRSVATFQGPAAFALKSHAPIVMLFMIRQQSGAYKLFCEEIQCSDLQDYSRENVEILTQRHVAVLEKWISQYPEQWLWMHKRWKNIK